MPKFIHHQGGHVHRMLDEIRAAVYTVVGTLDVEAWRTPEPVPFRRRRSGERMKLAVGDSWGGLFDCAWFRFTGRIPRDAVGRRVVLLIDVNGELCVTDRNGVPLCGLTNAASEFFRPLGEPVKRVLHITTRAAGNERIDVWADAGCNDLFGNVRENAAIKEAFVATCRDDVRALYYDYEVLLDYMKVAPADSARYQRMLAALNDVALLLTDFSEDRVRSARRILGRLLAKRGGDPYLSVSAVGQAHLDLGWLWPIRETVRKGARTFSTALRLMERYPDYVFGCSQPQLFLWMKEAYPALYAKVKQRVAEGRIEPQGAMWVEADCNVSGGEALVRQILQGKRFFRSEFGLNIRHLWLPDAFGYNAALPQMLRKSGVDYFMTQKLSWSLINKFPHHSFIWQGIDGSVIPTHLLPEDNYNSPAAPRSLVKIEKNYCDKDVSDRCLMVFGIGDGGGGPGEEHLERLERLRDLAGLPPVRQEWAAKFFEQWAKDAPRFATWVGELYLERHQGTYTTEAENKWYNRRMEQALRELEWTAALAHVALHSDYPSKRLEKIWREVLLYQFHDILPGSSIKRVYDESIARYVSLLAETRARAGEFFRLLARSADSAGMRRPVVAFNSLSWDRAEWVRVNGRWMRVSAPAMGYKVADMARNRIEVPGPVATAERLENDLLRVRFSRDGSIASVWDKRVRREAIAKGCAANRLAVYRDTGDAWDSPLNYAERAPRHMKLVSAAARIDGPRAVLLQTYRLGHSELQQEISLTAGSPRLVFSNRLRWREIRSMLRTSFPVDVRTDEATFEIQYGHVRRSTHRNTTWDLAMDEVPAHKWADLSERDYGVALLNDSKYGYKVKDNVLDLNLLRSVPYPGPRLVRDGDVKPGRPHHGYTDQSDHEFRYALLPHSGDHVHGRVVQEAYELNHPLQVVEVRPRKGQFPSELSFFQLDAPNVIIEAVKKAEDSDDLIVRLYESAGQRAAATLRIDLPVRSVAETDLMEEGHRRLAFRNGRVSLAFRPFEIKTLALKRAGK